ncbi:cytochrome P450 4C1-like [Diaphorina citri]|uniref:Cytochrome P450 4C1-like n=1 Tax=Diaphorina citri TaxID=121845 RepID=A0A3Q0J5J5_DIACI|nr:cytochrome P450 4C1-like [Diaphorina citri]
MLSEKVRSMLCRLATQSLDSPSIYFIVSVSGQKFALLEEKCVLASILRKFKVISLEKLDDVTIMIDLILRPASGVKVKLEPRHKIN